MKLFADAGASAEKTQRDYGEDLLVQFAFGDDEVQPAKIWIQVKGTLGSSCRRLADGSYSVRVKTDHLLRWLRSADPVMLVVWDAASDRGWGVWVHEVVALGEIYMSKAQTRAVRLPPASLLSGSEVPRVAWRALCFRFQRELLHTQAVQAYSAAMKRYAATREISDEAVVDPASVLIFDFCRLLGIFPPTGFSPDFVTTVERVAASFEGEDDFPTAEAALRAAIMLAVVGYVDELVPGGQTDGPLLESVVTRLLLAWEELKRPMNT